MFEALVWVALIAAVPVAGAIGFYIGIASILYWMKQN